MKRGYTCKNCNTDFIRYVCNVKSKLVFCSKKCKGRFYSDVLGKNPPSVKGMFIGEKSPVWIKDRSKLKKYFGSEERRSQLYKHWRKQTWLRDNFKCRIENKDCCGRIEVHHILSWREYPELRYQINNGITLCHAHHPRKRAEEKRLEPFFMELVSVSNL